MAPQQHPERALCRRSTGRRGPQRSLACLPAYIACTVAAALFVARTDAQIDNLAPDLKAAVSEFDIKGQGVVAVVIGISDDGQVAIWGQGAYGLRRFDSTAAVRVDDPFFIASCGKSFTSAVWGVLVTRGLARWADTIGGILKRFNVTVPGIKATYAGATIRQLLQHRAGFNDDTDWTAVPDPFFERISQAPPNLSPAGKTAVRRDYALYSLTEAPGARRGQFVFSNIGYSVAAWLSELVAGKNWESQVIEYFGKPLKLKLGFGLPYNTSTLDRVKNTGPVGQDCADGDLSLPAEDWEVYSPHIAGAGGLYMRVGDLATWVAWHVRGVKGLLPGRTYSTLMSQDAFTQLHAPFKAPDASNNGDYAMGWSNGTSPDEMQQDGSYAGVRTNMIGITQEDSDGNTLALAVATNVDDTEDGVCADAGSAALYTLTDSLITKYLPDVAPAERRRSMLDLSMGGRMAARRASSRRRRRALKA